MKYIFKLFDNNPFILVALLSLFTLKFINNWMFCDEAETLVLIKQMATGLTMYKDVFNFHGPLAYIPFVWLAKVPIGIFLYLLCRFFIYIAQFLILLTLYYVFRKENKYSAIISSLLFLSYLYIYILPNFGYQLLYQNITGIILSLSSIFIVYNAFFKFNNQYNLISIVLLSTLPYIAITYIPTFAILIFITFLISIKNKKVKSFFIINVVSHLLINIILLFYVDFSGYFVTHYYIIYKYLLNEPSLINTLYRILAVLKENILLVVIFLLDFTLLLILSKRVLINYCISVMIIFALFSLLLRGYLYWNGLPFLYLIGLITILLFISVLKGKNLFYFSISSLLLILIVGSLGFIYQKSFHRYFYTEKSWNDNNYAFSIKSNITQNTFNTKFSILTRYITTSNDKIVAWIWHPEEYLASERLPAVSNYAYFSPMIKYEYNEGKSKPILGLKYDTLNELKINKPKIILFDKWDINPTFIFDNAAPDIVSYINENYYKIKLEKFYIRKDIYDQYYGKVFLANFPDFKFEKESPIIEFNYKNEDSSTKLENLSENSFCFATSLSKDNLESLSFKFATYLNDYSNYTNSFIDVSLMHKKTGAHYSTKLPLSIIKDNLFAEIPLYNHKLLRGKYDICITSNNNSPLSLYSKQDGTPLIQYRYSSDNNFFITDSNWVQGIGKFDNVFFLPNNEFFREKYKIGKNLKYNNDYLGKVVSVEEHGQYLWIFYSGKRFLLNSNDSPLDIIIY